LSLKYGDQHINWSVIKLRNNQYQLAKHLTVMLFEIWYQIL